MPCQTQQPRNHVHAPALPSPLLSLPEEPSPTWVARANSQARPNTSSRATKLQTLLVANVHERCDAIVARVCACSTAWQCSKRCRCYRADRTRPDAACIITALVHGDHKYTHTLLKQTWPWRISDTPYNAKLLGHCNKRRSAARPRSLCLARFKDTHSKQCHKIKWPEIRNLGQIG